MVSNFEARLERYADAAIHAGLNLQRGQRLMMIGPRLTGGVAPEATPLVRALAATAYRAGSPLVEVLWGDEALQLLRFRDAIPESFAQDRRGSPKHWSITSRVVMPCCPFMQTIPISSRDFPRTA